MANFPDTVIIQVPGPQGSSGLSGITTPNSQVSKALPGLIAYAYNGAGLGTVLATSAGGTIIPAVTIVVPPTTYDIELTFGAWIGLNTAGGGGAGLWVYDWTTMGNAIVAGTANMNLTNIPVTSAGGTLTGECIVSASTTHRVFALTGQAFPDSGSPLVVYAGNLSVAPSYLKATAL